MLESWGDARAVDGTVTLIQPLIRRFFEMRSAGEMLSLLLGDPNAKDRGLVRATWAARWGEESFETRWRKAVHDGFIAEEATPSVRATPKPLSFPALKEPVGGRIEVVIRPDPSIWDGRFGNVAWLQELPKPITKVTWDNVVALDAELARELGVDEGDHVEIATESGRVVGPAWIMPGQAAGTATVTLGYGKSRGGGLERGIGYDANVLRAVQTDWAMTAALRRVAGRTKLATSQFHFAMGGNDFVRIVSRAEADVPQAPRPDESLYPERTPSRPAWGMSIDLDRCIGCNACVVACQAENNVPVVGKDQVAMGREMHWLRVDLYHEGPTDDPALYFQPVPCMHCEHAPCEMGCPVGATTHSPDGLNQMVYNRCIGTRTCSSYCPYKVRRFNWYDYTSGAAPGIRAQRNPDVTVRMRGVMEKCTYCIQRISAAHIAAEKDGRPIRDGEIVTACQAACPTKVIVFGDVADPDSTVSRAKSDPRDYSLLDELNTRPRTTYLARIVDAKRRPKSS